MSPSHLIIPLDTTESTEAGLNLVEAASKASCSGDKTNCCSADSEGGKSACCEVTEERVDCCGGQKEKAICVEVNAECHDAKNSGGCCDRGQKAPCCDSGERAPCCDGGEKAPCCDSGEKAPCCDNGENKAFACVTRKSKGIGCCDTEDITKAPCCGSEEDEDCCGKENRDSCVQQEKERESFNDG